MKQPANEFVTGSGIVIDRVYGPPEDPDRTPKLGEPGAYPFTRGIYPGMYRDRLWTMRQYAGFGTAEESNARYRYLLSQGVTGLSVAFDLPTQIGYDSDHDLAEGEVGRVGVAIDSLADMEVLFHGIPLEQITTSMTINATAAILLCLYVAVAEQQGAERSRLSGTIQNDILKEYIARGTHIYPPRPSLRIVTDIFRYCQNSLPRWNTISISGYHIREAGATAVQELAFTFANGIEYVRAAVEAGLDVNQFGSRLSFFFNSHRDFFEEIAKFRAARRIWAKIMKKRFGATNPKAQLLRFHTQTAGSTLTAQQPQNNVVRVSLQALTAVLGGTQSLHTNALDEALALPTEETVRTALRTQQIIAYESGATSTVDPLGGSYFVESLTDEIESRVWDYLQRITDMGGAIKAIEKQYMQNEIALSAYEYQTSVEKKDRVVVGVNEFLADDAGTMDVMKVAPEVRERQIARLSRLKESRDDGLVRKSLADLQQSARSTDNVIPPMLECVRAYATVGEISDALREVFGVYGE